MQGKRILITRPAKQAAKFAQLLAAAGAEPVLLPLIKTVANASSEFNAWWPYFHACPWFVFSSVNAVDHFFELKGEWFKELYPRYKNGIAAIGSATKARLVAEGFQEIWTASSFNGETLAKELPIQKDDKVFIPCSSKSLGIIPEMLKERGAVPIQAIIYDTVEEEQSLEDCQNRLKNIDVLTFTSPSAVISYKKLLEKFGLIKSKTYYAAIGSTTAKALEENGFPVDIVPKNFTLKDLTLAIKSFFEQKDHEAKSQ